MEKRDIKYYKNGVPVVESTKQETRKKAERVLTATLNAIASGDYLSPEDRKTTVADLWQGLVADYRVNEKAI